MANISSKDSPISRKESRARSPEVVIHSVDETWFGDIVSWRQGPMTKQVKTYPIGGNSAFPIECFERKVIREFDGCFAGHVEKKNFKFSQFHKPNKFHFKSQCSDGHRKF